VTYSAAWCSFFSSDGVDTTYATRRPSGDIRTSTIDRSFISSSIVGGRGPAVRAPMAAAATATATAPTVEWLVFIGEPDCARKTVF
jgi:hypothetical protein